MMQFSGKLYLPLILDIEAPAPATFRPFSTISKVSVLELDLSNSPNACLFISVIPGSMDEVSDIKVLTFRVSNS